MKVHFVVDETDEEFAVVDFPFRDWRKIKRAAFMCGLSWQEFILDAIDERLLEFLAREIVVIQARQIRRRQMATIAR